jgi:hypothetical protein
MPTADRQLKLAAGRTVSQPASTFLPVDNLVCHLRCFANCNAIYEAVSNVANSNVAKLKGSTYHLNSCLLLFVRVMAPGTIDRYSETAQTAVSCVHQDVTSCISLEVISNQLLPADLKVVMANMFC